MTIRRWASRTAIAAMLVAGVVSVGGSAQAAVPDRFGFALVTSGVVSQAVPPGTTAVGAGGHWTVRFPGQGFPRGVVHVTAVNTRSWCQAESWGPVGADEVVRLACYQPGGVLDPTAGFSVQFSASSGPVGGGYFGYVDSNAAGAILASYNSVGAGNTVVHGGVGIYSVTFPGFGTPAGTSSGGLEVTAVNPAVGARCKVGALASGPNGQTARILCHNSAGALADNRFTVTYQFRRTLFGPAFPPNRFGYLHNQPPLGPPGTNFNSTGAVNTLAGVGPWSVRFPNLGIAPGTMQVTSFGINPDYCNLMSPWVFSAPDVFARIACYNNAGVSVGGGFFTTFSSRY